MAGSCADPENFLRLGGGGGVQIPRRGLTENFSTWQKLSKDKSMAIPEGVRTPVGLSPDLDLPMGIPRGNLIGKFDNVV